MLLYHGSNVEVHAPLLGRSRSNLDFGKGFYLTSDFNQAAKWASRTVRLRGTGSPLVSSFLSDESAWARLNVKRFAGPDEEWLRFVAINRTRGYDGEEYDLVIGPVANDQTIRTVNDFIRGRFTEVIAIELLRPQKLKDQFAFRTEDALKTIEFCEVQAV